MPLLSLETWRQITGYHPLHFWGIYDQNKAPILSTCNDLVRQYEWQAAQRVGRRDIETYLDQSADILAAYLRFSVGARAVEWLDVPVVRDTLVLPEGYIQALGREVYTLLDSPTIVITDADGDGLLDTGTALTIALPDPAAELVVFFAESDRVPDQRDDWRIAPARISISAGVATITIPSRLLITPALYESIPTASANGLLCNVAGNYVPTIAVYARTITSTGAVAIDGTAVTATICDARNGVLTLSRACTAYCIDTCVTRCPHRTASVAAIAGIPLGGGLIERRWRPILAQLTAALIPGQLCECKQADTFLHTWQQDVSRIGNPQEEFAFKEAAINNPIGTRRGHIAAWQAIRLQGHERGFRF